MKKILIALAFWVLASTASAQYQINWFGPGGGGAQSSGGVYTLTGAIGLSDTGSTAGGPYTLTGGFWSFIGVVSTQGAPTIRIVRDGMNLILAWSNSSTGVQLQETSSLSPPKWADVNTAPVVVGNETQVRQSFPQGTRFYRLRKL
jgi:hypothetical protein